MGLVSTLYKLARFANDVKTLASGNPKKIVKRQLNKIIYKKIGRRFYLR